MGILKIWVYKIEILETQSRTAKATKKEPFGSLLEMVGVTRLSWPVHIKPLVNTMQQPENLLFLEKLTLLKEEVTAA